MGDTFINKTICPFLTIATAVIMSIMIYLMHFYAIVLPPPHNLSVTREFDVSIQETSFNHDTQTHKNWIK